MWKSIFALASVALPIPAQEALVSLNCDREASLRSVSSNSPSSVEFSNATNAPVNIYWLDYAGKRVRYAVLAARESYTQTTFVTNPWVVTNAQDQCLAIFQPTEQPGRAVVEGAGIFPLTAGPLQMTALSIVDASAAVPGQMAVLMISGSNFAPGLTAKLTTPSGTADVPGNVTVLNERQIVVGATVPATPSGPYNATLTISNAAGESASRTFAVGVSTRVPAGTLGLQSVITLLAGVSREFRGEGKAATGEAIGFISGLATDSIGTTYASLGNVVVSIEADGVIRVVAGNGLFGFSGDGGLATNASLQNPTGLAIDPRDDRTLYILDSSGSRVRKVTRDGRIQSIAGVGLTTQTLPLGDHGPALEASFNSRGSSVGSLGLAVDRAGNIYIPDTTNQRIRKVDANGIITTVAGNGRSGYTGDTGLAVANALDEVGSVAVDEAGNLYLAGGSAGRRIRRVSPDGTIATVAGGGTGVVRNGARALDVAMTPQWVAVGQGYVYTHSRGTALIHRIGPDGLLQPAAGTGVFNATGQIGDGGPATLAPIGFPVVATADEQGRFTFGDDVHRRIRQVNPGKIIQTIAGSGGYGHANEIDPTYARISAGPDGKLWVADFLAHRLRVVSAEGTVQTAVGSDSQEPLGDGGPAERGNLAYPSDTYVDAMGNVYVADRDHARVRKVGRDGIIQTVYRAEPGSAVERVTADAGGNLFVQELVFAGVQRIPRLYKFTPAGSKILLAGASETGPGGEDGPATQVRLENILDLTADAQGNLYFAESMRENASWARVRTIGPDGKLRTVAGGGGVAAAEGIPALAARIHTSGIEFDAAGKLHLSDILSRSIYRLEPDGRLQRIAGGTRCETRDGGPASRVCISPRDISFDKAGNLFVVDVGAAGGIRKILATAPTYDATQPLPEELSFAAPSRGAAVRKKLLVSTTISDLEFGGTAMASVETGASWLRLSPSNGLTPRILEITADPATLEPRSAPYEGVIKVTIPDTEPQTKLIRVALRVGAPLPPKMVVDTDSVSFPYPDNASSRTDSITVTNQGSGDLAFSIRAETSSGGAWLSVTPADGLAKPGEPVTIQLTANPSGLRGTYRGRLTIEGAGTRTVLPVTMGISRFRRAFTLTQKGLSFRAVEGGGIVPPQSFGVANLGPEPLSWSARTDYKNGTNWIALQNVRAVSAASTPVPEVTVGVNHAGLTAGTYYALVEVRGEGAGDNLVANSPQVVPVFLEVLPAGSVMRAAVEPTDLVFSINSGKLLGSQDVFVYNVGAVPKSFVVRPGVGTTLLPQRGVLDPRKRTRVVVQPLAGMPPGQYSGKLTFQFSDGDVREVSYTVIVTNPAVAATPKSAQRAAESCGELTSAVRIQGGDLTVTPGWPLSLQVAVVDNCGQPMTDGTVVVRFSNGDPPLVLTSLRDGRWDGGWTTTGNAGEVTLTVEARRSNGIRHTRDVSVRQLARQEKPSFNKQSIRTYSSLRGGEPIAPGSIVRISGEGLAEGVGDATERAAWPTTQALGGAQVFIGDRPLALWKAGKDEILGQIPFELEPDTVWRLYLVRGGLVLSSAVDVDVASAQPVIESVTRTGDAVEIVCSGLGPLEEKVTAGDSAASGKPKFGIAVTIDGVAATGVEARYVRNRFVVRAVTTAAGLVVVSVDTGDQVVASEPVAIP